VGSHRHRKPAALERLGLPALQRGGRTLLRVGKTVIESYVNRKRKPAAAGERLAEAMVRYAKLCMSPVRSPQDLESDSVSGRGRECLHRSWSARGRR
jgi:hypothetical protein